MRLCMCGSLESPWRLNSISRCDIIAADDKIEQSRRYLSGKQVFNELYTRDCPPEKRDFFSWKHTQIHRGSFIRYNAHFIGDIKVRFNIVCQCPINVADEDNCKGSKRKRKDVKRNEEEGGKKKMRRGRSALFRQARFEETLSSICSLSIRLSWSYAMFSRIHPLIYVLRHQRVSSAPFNTKSSQI